MGAASQLCTVSEAAGVTMVTKWSDQPPCPEFSSVPAGPQPRAGIPWGRSDNGPRLLASQALCCTCGLQGADLVFAQTQHAQHIHTQCEVHHLLYTPHSQPGAHMHCTMAGSALLTPPAVYTRRRTCLMHTHSHTQSAAPPLLFTPPVRHTPAIHTAPHTCCLTHGTQGTRTTRRARYHHLLYP